MELLVDATDEELLSAGDTSTLVRRYYGPVIGLARRLLRDPAEARDAAQETFSRAIAALNGFERGRSFRAWLFAIEANYIRDLLRRKKQLPLTPDVEESLPELAPPDERILRTENRQKLEAAIDRLPFDLKIVVTLHFQQDLPHAEIASTLAVSVNAIRIRLYRALAALRKEMS